MKKKKRKGISSKLMLVFALVIPVLLVGILVSGTLGAPQGNFELTLKWNGTDSWLSDGGNTYTYASISEEERLVRMKVSYKNTNVGDDYPAGSIVITVPGIAEAYRGTALRPVAISADPSSATKTTYDWTYNYNSSTDIYTFYNNAPIDMGATFAGSFEIIWAVPSRESKHEVSFSRSAKMTARTFSLESNTISYSATRAKDTYTISIKAKPMISAEGLEAYLPSGDQNTDNYTWAQYTVTGSKIYNARGINSSEVFGLWVPEGAIIINNDYTKSNFVSTGITKDGHTLWTQTYGITKYTPRPYWEDIIIAYPNSRYENQRVNVCAQKLGTYFEESSESVLAEDNEPIMMDDYRFLYPNGEFGLYGFNKQTIGIHSAFINKHDIKCWNWGGINGSHMFNGKQMYRSNLLASVGYDKSQMTSYDLELYDDIMDVDTLSDGLRQLRDDEYSFVKVVIPRADELRNINGIPIKADTYNVEIWVRYRNTPLSYDSFVQLTGGIYDNLKYSTKQQEITLPEGVVGIKFVARGLKESLKGGSVADGAASMAYLYYIFHSKSVDIRTENGQFRNLMHGRIIIDGVMHESIAPSYHYSRDNEYQRDVAAYGHGVWRMMNILHILEVPNEHSLETNIKQTAENAESFEFTADIKAAFNYAEGGDDLNNYSMYTILPEGMQLPSRIKTEDDLKKYLTISGTGIGAQTLQDSVEFTIDPDYQGSGRTYIAAKFIGLTGKPTAIKITGIPMFLPRDILKAVNVTIKMEAVGIVEQGGTWYANGVDNKTGIWNDINQDKRSTDVAALADKSIKIYNAASAHLQVTKVVETGLTDGYVQPKYNENVEYQEEIPMSYVGEEYSYKLRIKLGEFKARSIVFADNIEESDRKSWEGEFVKVDYSDAVKLLKGTPTVYYSSEYMPLYAEGANGTEAIEPDFTDSRWSTEKPPTVKAVAVAFDENAVAEPGSFVYVVIKMKAPSDATTESNMKNSTKPFYTENRYSIHYEEIDLSSGTPVDERHLPSNFVPVLLSPFRGTISLRKTDGTSGEGISGAVFSLYMKEDGSKDKLIKSGITTVDGKATVSNLIYGDYYFVETTTPLGYIAPSDVFPVTLRSEKADAFVTKDIINDRKQGQLTLRKTSDLNDQFPAAGAEFALFYADGREVEYSGSPLITDANGKLTLTGLVWGDYYLKEVKAPFGFNLPEESKNKYPFTIKSSNDAGSLITMNITNPQKPCDVYLLKLERLQNDRLTDTGVSGAYYALFTESGKKLGTYRTDNDGIIHVEGLGYGKYYFSETTAAEGYSLNEVNDNKIEFELVPENNTPGDNIIGINETNKPIPNRTIKTDNQRLYGKIILQKLDETGLVVNGAKYGLFPTKDANANPAMVGTTDNEGFIKFEKVEWGTWYIREIEAPKGYALNPENYEVVVDRWTVRKPVIVDAADAREKGSVLIQKVSEAHEATVLPGAVFNLYTTSNKLVEAGRTTDSEGKILFEGLDWGSYYLQEVEAPEGYGLNPDKIRFSVNYFTGGETQVIKVTDPRPTYDLKVGKRIKEEDILYTHGSPTFIFKVAGTDVNGDTHEFYKSVTFDAETVDSLDPIEGYVELSVIFAGIPAGTYTVSEVNVDRYGVSQVDLGPNTSGTVTLPTANVTLGYGNETGWVIFTNTKKDQSDSSHNAVVVNVVRKSRLLTALVTAWKGSDKVTGELIDRDQLEVWAVYDDGTQEKLDNDQYELLDGLDNPAEPLSGTGNFTVYASYTENGITRTGSFDLSLDVIPVFTWVFPSSTNKVLFDGVEYTKLEPIVYEGVRYDGVVSISGYYGVSEIVRFPKTVTGTWSGVTWSEDHGFVKDTSGNDTSTRNNTDGYFYSKTGGTYTTDEKTYLVTQLGVGGFGSLSGVKLPKTAKNLIFPDSLEKINQYAFLYYRQIEGSIDIPESVTDIGTSAFDNVATAKGISSVSVTIGGNCSIGNAAFGSIGRYAEEDVSVKISGTHTVGHSIFTSVGRGDATTHPRVTIDLSGEINAGNEIFIYCGEYAKSLNISINGIGNGMSFGHSGFVFAGSGTDKYSPEDVNISITGKVTLKDSEAIVSSQKGVFSKAGLYAQSVSLKIDASDMYIGTEAFSELGSGKWNIRPDNVAIDIRGKITIADGVKLHTAYDANTKTETRSASLDRGAFNAAGRFAKSVSLKIDGDDIHVGTGTFRNLAGGNGWDQQPNHPELKIDICGKVTFAGEKLFTYDHIITVNGVLDEVNTVMGQTLSEHGAFSLAGKYARICDLSITGTGDGINIGTGTFVEFGSGHPEGNIKYQPDSVKIDISGNITIADAGIDKTGAFYKAGECAKEVSLKIDGNDIYVGTSAFRIMGYGSASFHPDVTIDVRGNVTIADAEQRETGAFRAVGYRANKLSVTLDVDNAVIGTYAFNYAGEIANDVSLKIVGGNSVQIKTTAFQYFAAGTTATQPDSVSIDISGKVTVEDATVYSAGAFFQAGFYAKNVSLSINGNGAILGTAAFAEFGSGTTAIHPESVKIDISGDVTINDAPSNGLSAFYYAGRYAKEVSVSINGTGSGVTIGHAGLTRIGYGETTVRPEVKVNISGNVTIKDANTSSLGAFHRLGYYAKNVDIIVNGSGAGVTIGTSAFSYVAYGSAAAAQRAENVMIDISGKVTINDAGSSSLGAFYVVGKFAKNVTLNINGSDINLGASAFSFLGSGDEPQDGTLCQPEFVKVQISGNTTISDHLNNNVETGVFYQTGRHAKKLTIDIKGPVTIGKAGFIETGSYADDVTLTLGDGIVAIKERAFAEMTKISNNVTVPNDVGNLEDDAFRGSGKQGVTLSIPSRFDTSKTGWIGPVTTN